MDKALKDMSLEELWQLFPIILKEHNPEYEIWFEQERRNIIHALGNSKVCRINHIGSTAVWGLISKPTVDILLELPENYDMKNVKKRLEQDGWILMKNELNVQTMVLNKGYTPQGFSKKVFHLHVRPFGDWDELYFRDYLRKHHEVANAYGELKIKLLDKYKHNRDAYTDAKSNFIKDVTSKAKKEYNGRYS